MSSSSSAPSLQNLLARAISVSDSSSWSTISDTSTVSHTHEPSPARNLPRESQNPVLIPAPSCRQMHSETVRILQCQQDPFGSVSGPASPKTAAAPQNLQSNTSIHSTSHREIPASSNLDLLLAHTTFPSTDTPAPPDGYDVVSFLPIALFVPSAHIPELWSPTGPPRPGNVGTREEERERYTLSRYLAESLSEDSYPLRCRLHLRKP